MEQSTERAIEESEQSIDRAQEWPSLSYVSVTAEKPLTLEWEKIRKIGRAETLEPNLHLFGNRYFGAPQTSRTCYRTPSCRRIFPFALLLAKSEPTQLVGPDVIHAVVLCRFHPMLCDLLKSRFALLDAVTSPSKSMSWGPPLAYWSLLLAAWQSY
jgi:hypothetical protein